MLRKIISILVMAAVLFAIVLFTVNYYNKSKLEASNKNNSSEVIKKNSKKDNKESKKKDSNETSNKSSSDSKSNENSSVDDKSTDENDDLPSDDNSVVLDEEKEETEKIITDKEVAVPSTSSFGNIYIPLVGATIVLVGVGSLYYKYSN